MYLIADDDGRQYAKRWLELNEVKKRILRRLSKISMIFLSSKIILIANSNIFCRDEAKLFFGVATAPSANIFLIDEVLSVGDMYFTTKCWKRLVIAFQRCIRNSSHSRLVSHTQAMR